MHWLEELNSKKLNQLQGQYNAFICLPGKVCTIERKSRKTILPAPHGYKSKYKMRKIWHFFVGLNSGNPSEIGVVTACSPQSAQHFFEEVKQRALPGFEDFDLSISSFYLESVEKLKLGYGVGVSFLDE